MRMPSHSASGGGPGSGGGSGGGDGDGGEPGEGGCEGGVGGTFGGPSTNHATAFSNAGLSKNIVVCAISLVAISASSSYEWACISQYVSALISADGWDTKGDFGGRVGECCEFTKAEVWIVLARLVREGCNERACGKSKKRDERPHSPVLRALSLTLFFQGSRGARPF